MKKFNFLPTPTKVKSSCIDLQPTKPMRPLGQRRAEHTLHLMGSAVISAVVTLSAGPGLALGPADDVYIMEQIGSDCKVFVISDSSSPEASVHIRISTNEYYDAGGTYWASETELVNGDEEITVESIASCLETEVGNVTSLTQVGADAVSLSAEDDMGFSFTLTTAAGNLSAGPHGYFIRTKTPTADAGADQPSVEPGATVTLDGTGSSDPDAFDTLTYAWTQTSGTPISLSSLTAAQPTFTAPTLEDNDSVETFVFSLAVTDERGNVSADTVSITVGSSQNPAAEFEAKKDAIRSIITDDAQRSLNSTLASNTRLIREARGRLVTGRTQMQSDGAGLTSRNDITFNVDGIALATPEQMSTQGMFLAQAGNFDGTQRRLIFGDFDLQRDGDTGSTTATINGKIAWEHMLSEQTMLGYYLGGEVSHSNIKDTFAGTKEAYGLSVGVYSVQALQKNLFLDGFASLGAGHNNLAMSDDTLDLTSKYTTQTVTLGAAVSGIIEQASFEIQPELSVVYGRTSIGRVGFTGVAGGLTDETLSLDAGYVSKASLTFRPEVIIPIGAEVFSSSNSQISIAPRLICEHVKSTTKKSDCGTGGEVGFTSTSEDGLSSADIGILFDSIHGGTRSSFVFSVEHKF